MPIRMLVVDDEFSIRSTLIEHFTQCGYQVDGAESGNDAFSVIQKKPTTIVF